MKGTVSVIMNCFNSDTYLNLAIKSVLAQSYDNLEIIFWDNQSTDRSSTIACSFGDDRLKYFLADEHTTLGRARYLALREARGEFVAFLDCDDEWMPHKLETQMRIFDDPDIGFTFGGALRVNAKGELLQRWVPKPKAGYLFQDLVADFNVDMLTPVIRRSVLIEHGISFNPEMHACEEVNLFLRLSLQTQGLSLPEPLGISRRLDGSLSRTASDKIHLDLAVTVEQIINEYPQAYMEFDRELDYLRYKVTYHHLRSLMQMNRVQEARRLLVRESHEFMSFKVLRLVIQVPYLWDLGQFLMDKLPRLKRHIIGRGLQ